MTVINIHTTIKVKNELLEMGFLMTQNILETLRAIDPAELLEVVRQDQSSPTFEILDWHVEPFGDKMANANTGFDYIGQIFSFSGQGQDEQGIRPWRVVVKTFKDPGTNLDPRHLRYWKRELLAMQSGFLANLPGPVVAPRCYGINEHEGGAWIWMEHIVDHRSPTWTADQYAFAAHELGHFNGRCFANNSLPDYPWLCKGHVRTKTEVWAPHHAWENPFVNQAFPPQTRERVLRLWDERNRFYDALERLPQLFSHFDFHRRNCLIRRQEDGTDQIVAIDWAWAGYGALGADLYSVVGGSALIFEIEAADVAQIEIAAFEAYFEGLGEAGWTGNPDTVRLAYDICFAMFLATCAPAVTAYMAKDNMEAFVFHQFKRSCQEMASGWSALCELALDRADEARLLMDRLL